MTLGREPGLRAAGMALAGLSAAFAIYMLAYGGGKTRIYGMEHLAIFAQPRGASPPSQEEAAPAVDLSATGSLAPQAPEAHEKPGPVEIVAANPDRVWLRVGSAIRTAARGDQVEGLGRIGAIVPRDGGWVLLDDKGAALLATPRESKSSSLFTRKMIFQ
jgi:hypothetical protein